ncbi:hypothetical protein FZ934_20225 (plasmid) [Rhizobium grahamii]|uniref:Uncharacterized protein n=1 Tax=Rhizobium grahamii TaxID=1120045 RepID=A0A5Q0CFT1_9HYPH|nr:MULTISPECIES: hypothetical protein [Rhizobium]QFY62709.1 hypothetical protein FZ934_20225 [Rhizobium grahamii]QRM52547.1 hypothetical protein F3Y33_25435 [Rhizobium sp. BG6]
MMTKRKHAFSEGGRALSALRQIKAFTRKPELDCGCSTVVGEVLASLEPSERASVVSELFSSAIRQRTKVATLLELLREFDELGPATDIGELEEAAMIFEDLAEQARLGSQLLRAFTFNRRDLRGSHGSLATLPLGARR